MLSAVRVFEQTAKSSLRVTLLASVACSGNKPVYTVTIQPNSSPESVQDGSGRQFPSRKVFIKNNIGESSFCAEIVEAVRGLLAFYSILCSPYFMCVLPAGDGLDSSLPTAGVNEESF